MGLSWPENEQQKTHELKKARRNSILRRAELALNTRSKLLFSRILPPTRSLQKKIGCRWSWGYFYPRSLSFMNEGTSTRIRLLSWTRVRVPLFANFFERGYKYPCSLFFINEGTSTPVRQFPWTRVPVSPFALFLKNQGSILPGKLQWSTNLSAPLPRGFAP